jgi:signal transduction histidine kinase|tara:strand:- start:583 stop:717 length:135 start_codon:yes stop_codon:yes gene_type:complete
MLPEKYRNTEGYWFVYDYEGLRLLNKVKELLELEEELDLDIEIF